MWLITCCYANTSTLYYFATKMKRILIFMLFILKIMAEKKYNFSLKFFQNDYHLVPEWFEVASFDKAYVKEMKTSVHKFNRTITTLNLTCTFNVDFGYNLELILQLYKFASNEYREFPIRVEANFCQGLEQDFCGVNQLVEGCGNFTGCPLKKGKKYHACNWIPDDSKLPPYIPTGRYMAEVQGIFNSKEVFLWRSYNAITREEYIRRN